MIEHIKVLEDKSDLFGPSERAIGISISSRVQEFELAWNLKPMKLYRSATLQLLSQLYPSKKIHNTLFEFGAGIGKISREFVQTPYFKPEKTYTIIANDLSPLALQRYSETVTKANKKIAVASIINTVNKAIDSPELEFSQFSNAYGFGVYQLSQKGIESMIKKIIPHLENNGKLIFDFIPALQEEHKEYTSSHGNYSNYRFTTEEMKSILDKINKEMGYSYIFSIKRYSELKDIKTGKAFESMIIESPHGIHQETFDPAFVVIEKQDKKNADKRKEMIGITKQTRLFISDAIITPGPSQKNDVEKILKFVRGIRLVKNDQLIRVRTANEIVQDGYIVDETDRTIVLIALCRSIGIPASYMEIQPLDWMKSPLDSRNLIVESRGISNVWYDYDWHVVDPQRDQIDAKIERHNIYREDKDGWALNIRTLKDLEEKMISYKIQWQLEKGIILSTAAEKIKYAQVNNLVWCIDKAGRAHVIEEIDNSKKDSWIVELVKKLFNVVKKFAVWMKELFIF